jgi:hypothetical protein
MNLGWFLRMSKWARRPPSAGQVKLVLAVVALCFVLWGVEHIWGWPEALRVNGKVKP